MSVSQASALAAASSLGVLLRMSSRLGLVVAGLRAACRWGAIVLAAVLMVVVVDGFLGLSVWGLVTADLATLGLVGLGVLVFIRTASLNWHDPRNAARQAESRLGLRDGRLVSAWDLAESPPAHASSELVRQSVQEANQYARQLPVSATVAMRPLGRAALLLAAVILIGLGGLVAVPRMFAAVLPRLADPWGDHPPFTLVEFDVKIEPQPILYGRSATIIARLGGPEDVERANVVFVDPAVPNKTGKTQWKVSRFPMLRRPEGEFVLPIDRAETSREFYVDTPCGRSRRYQLTVLPVPTFEAATVQYVFPAYTDWPTVGHVLDSRGIQALEGTQITLKVTSNVPLKEGMLTLTPRTRSRAEKRSPDKPAPPVTIVLKPVAGFPNDAAASFPLTFSGLFHLTLTGADGTPSRDHLEGPLTCVADRPPQIEIVDPAPLTLAVEKWKVPVEFAARDDVAVKSITLQASVNGWGPHPRDVAFDQTQKASVRADSEFDLGELGASAGDVITFYATARDNRPPHGQSTDTASYVIQVISEEEYLDFARSKYRMEEVTEEFEKFQKDLETLEQQREQLLEEAAALKEAMKDGELSPNDLERLRKLEDQLAAYEKAAQDLAEQLQKRAEQPTLYDFEESLKKNFEDLSRQMKDQASAAKGAKDAAEQLRKQQTARPQSAADQKRAQEDLEQALEKLQKENAGLDEKSQAEREQTAEDLEKLRQADEMLSQAERLQSLVQQQRDLADRMAELRDSESLTPEQQERARQLAKEQELLEQELSDATQALEKAAEKAGDSLPQTASEARKLCQAIREGDIPGDQQGAARSARSGNGKSAAERAEEAAKKLEALQCEACNAEGMGEEMSLDGGLKLSRQGGKNSLKQLSLGRQVPGIPRPGNKGEKGQGQGGSPTRVSIAGPHTPSSGQKKETRNGKQGDGGRGQGGQPQAESLAESPESIDPQARTGKTSAAGNLRGVPVRYRDQAEAFFKRLAEEQGK